MRSSDDLCGNITTMMHTDVLHNETRIEDFARQGFPGSMSYTEYRELVLQAHTENRTTGPQAFDKYLDYSILNEKRMNRIDKTVDLTEELSAHIRSIASVQHWVLITESWCGDASQSVPVIAKMAALNERIRLHIILRDRHEAIMDQYLTNGGRSIPKLIVLDEALNELFIWGPRPDELQQMFLEYRNSPEPKMPYGEFAEHMQRWYNTDKSASMQQEFLALPVQSRG